jgi:iron complex outermembrane receptor protein
MDEAAAHLAARGFADKNMPAVESSTFEALRDKYAQASISAPTDGGGGFLEKTNMYHAEGMYNFKNQIKFIDLIAGANVRRYQLRSNGTLFSDTKDGRDGVIPIDEYGAFAQASKSLFKDHFKLTASLRYDKNENFDGQFTPRVSGVATFGEQNIRLSYQSGFRIPTTQNQYIDLRTPSGTLIGGQPEFDTRYNLSKGIPVYVLTDFSKNPTKYITDAVKAAAQQYATAAVTAQLPAIQMGVIAAVQAQVTAAVTAQVNAAVAAGQIPAANAPAAIQQGVITQMNSDAVKATISTQVTAVVTQQITAVTTQVVPAYALASLPKYQAKALVPEKIQSYEIGYKGLIAKKLFIDAYYYYSRYRDFLGGISVVVPLAAAGPGLPIESGAGSASTRAGYSRPANTSEDITVDGWALSANYSLPKGFNFGGNIAFNQLKGFTPSPEQQYAGFNTPDYRYNLSFGKRLGSGDKVGFNINFRHQNAFVWEASFNQPTTTSNPSFTNTPVPAINNIDAQVSFKLPAMKSIIKVGGTNIGGKPYVQAYGSASVGSMYYVSLSFDELLNR